MTENALNHRFRRLRAQSVLIREAAKKNYDMKNLDPDENNLPGTQGEIDLSRTTTPSPPIDFFSLFASTPTLLGRLCHELANMFMLSFIDIAKYFGASTTDGIQFQFRTIKKDADTLRATAEEGGDLANCISLGVGTGGSNVGTPSSRNGTPSKRGRKTPSQLKKTPIKSAHGDSDEDTDGYSGDEESPTKRGKMGGLKKEEDDSFDDQSVFGSVKPHKTYLAPQYEDHADDDEEIAGEI